MSEFRAKQNFIAVFNNAANLTIVCDLFPSIAEPSSLKRFWSLMKILTVVLLLLLSLTPFASLSPLIGVLGLLAFIIVVRARVGGSPRRLLS